MTLLAPYFAIHGLKFLRRVNQERILNMIFVALMLLLIPTNCLVLYNDVVAYKPVERPCRADLNYFTMINYWSQNPHLGVAYLDDRRTPIVLPGAIRLGVIDRG